MNPTRLLKTPLFIFSLLLVLAGKVLAAAEIKLEQPVGTELIDNGTLSFGDVSIGSTVSKTVRIRNTGDFRLTISSWALNGTHQADYGFTKTSFSPNSWVDPASSKDFLIFFTPSTGGLRTAKLTVFNTDTNEGQYDINLTGTGVGPDVDVLQANRLITNNNTVNFGTIAIGGSANRAFTIRNLGTSPLSSVSVGLEGSADWSYSGAVSSTLALGQSFTIFVRWSPSASGADVATLQIFSNDPNENPFTINLTGTGAEPGQGDQDDPDGDGILNLIEEATGSDKNLANTAPGTFVINGATAEFTYTRSVASTSIMLLSVETADSATVSTGWTVPAGFVSYATELSPDGTTETMFATWPLPPEAPSHFVRLRATRY